MAHDAEESEEGLLPRASDTPTAPARSAADEKFRRHDIVRTGRACCDKKISQAGEIVRPRRESRRRGDAHFTPGHDDPRFYPARTSQENRRHGWTGEDFRRA